MGEHAFQYQIAHPDLQVRSRGIDVLTPDHFTPVTNKRHPVCTAKHYVRERRPFPIWKLTIVYRKLRPVLTEQRSKLCRKTRIVTNNDSLFANLMSKCGTRCYCLPQRTQNDLYFLHHVTSPVLQTKPNLALESDGHKRQG